MSLMFNTHPPLAWNSGGLMILPPSQSMWSDLSNAVTLKPHGRPDVVPLSATWLLVALAFAGPPVLLVVASLASSSSNGLRPSQPITIAALDHTS